MSYNANGIISIYLSLQMKAWAKAHDINNPRDRTLNSFTIVLLVAFHLQVEFTSYLILIIDL
ncbi:hypothetical protein HanOQP8_Chr03g0093981 [Helianthus annuus]|nr:hypothetical protein HanOQP8_Chr03g0093981 [Helianthus annuus]